MCKIVEDYAKEYAKSSIQEAIAAQMLGISVEEVKQAEAAIRAAEK